MGSLGIYKEKGSKRDTDGRNRVQVLVPFSALAAIAGLLSFDVASVLATTFKSEGLGR